MAVRGSVRFDVADDEVTGIVGLERSIVAMLSKKACTFPSFHSPMFRASSCANISQSVSSGIRPEFWADDDEAVVDGAI